MTRPLSKIVEEKEGEDISKLDFEKMKSDTNTKTVNRMNEKVLFKYSSEESEGRQAPIMVSHFKTAYNPAMENFLTSGGYDTQNAQDLKMNTNQIVGLNFDKYLSNKVEILLILDLKNILFRQIKDDKEIYLI